MHIYTTAQMRAYDEAAIADGISSLVLMEHAALRVVEFLEHKFAPLQNKRIVIFCGKGNNGGDGLACARLLHQAGADINVLLAFPPDNFKGDAQRQYEIVRKNPGINCWNLESITPAQKEELRHCDIALDALLGTGFHGEPRGAGLLCGLELLKSTFAARVAIDIPSGLSGDNGNAIESCVVAQFTVTFGGIKTGMLTSNGTAYCGEIWVGSIGADNLHFPQINTGLRTIDAHFVKEYLPRWTNRSSGDDKRAAGKVLLCGGSLGMSGAPTLAATAVLRSGAGLCIAALPQKIIPIFASALIEATSVPLPNNENGQLTMAVLPFLEKWWMENTGVMALGPGISRHKETLQLVRQIALKCPLPLIVDADALHALAPIADALKKRQAPLILTPHGGEMAALLEISPHDLPENRVETAQRCAEKYGAIVVYKGHLSVVAAPLEYRGESELERNLRESTFINLTGNPGMASGGSGDVLTGIVSGILAQDGAKHPFLSVLVSVYLHGLAGDIAFQQNGNGLMAGDIARQVPKAIQTVAFEKTIIENRLIKVLLG